ncbi:MAG: chromosome segregation protein SMC [Opitutaceae bacterium]|jgi:chromosome segregation protein
MYLKALKLHGFKSFADNSTLRFEPGVTAVVGPNGCGKSNIADAIRWVLGEQSAKALRGGKMQDVIFEGTDTRKPSQICEVSLLLTDCEKQLGSEFHEIEIMRRVHRDGQGEYYFNGQACRLRDIQRLFMDTGVGRTSYSIMAQGQIDQILSSKPEERRAVFEEAAGITKYKSQRREALQKLSLTDQNLMRVADVIGEVGRQINSLRRQASKALRFKRLSYRLRHLVLAQSGWQHGQLAATLADLQSKVGALRTESDARRANLEQQQSAIEAKRAERSRLNQRVQDAQQAVFDIRSEKEQSENAASVSSIKRNGLLDRLKSARGSLGELEMQIRELTAQVDSGAQDKQMQLNLLGSSDAVFQNRNREVVVVDAELAKSEQELEQCKFELLQVESSVARLRTDCSGYEVDQKTSVHKHEALALDLEGVRQQQAAATQLVGEYEVRVEESLAEKARAHSEASAAQQLIADLTREFREAQRKLQDIDRQLAQRSARLKLLQQLHERWEGFGEGAKALLQGRLNDSLGDAKITAISHGLEIKPDCAKALEALLGNAAEAVSVADLATAQRILSRLEAEQIGSVVMHVAECVRAAGEASGDLPAFLQPALRALKNTDANHPAASLLSACFLADDLGSFLDYWKANPSFSFLAVATRKGEVVDRRGLVFGGHQKKNTAGIVQREIDLRETSRLLAEDQKAHDDQKTAIDLLGARLTEAEQQLEQRRADFLAITEQLTTVQTESRNAQRSLEEVTSRVRRMEGELAGLEQARDEARLRWERAQTALTEAEAGIQARKNHIAALEKRIAEARVERDVKRESLSQARLDLAERRQKVEVLDRGLVDMERRRSQLTELLVQRQQEIETWTEQIGELEREAERQHARRAQLAETLVVAQQQVEQIRIELVELERSIDGVEASQTHLRQDADSALGELSRCEIKLAETSSRSQFIDEDIQREFQVSVGSYDWRSLLWRSDDDPPDLKALDLDDDEDSEAEAEARSQKPEASVQTASSAQPDAVVQAGEAGAATPEADADGAKKAKHRHRKIKIKQRLDPTEDDLKALEQVDWAPVKTEIDALRQRIASMGAVNLVAIEEYADLKQRYDFLKAQSDDLTNAKTELLKTIDEINQTSMKQFEVTFEQIKKNFEFTFLTLFGGGRAHLELVQSDDILESGIEIIAQPPGTKLKSITLLSGGQKTLTAVALLFALYMVKPSPFCLLDELDAPLDESNIGRFTDLLKRFVHESQFIIITHNKRTVAAAHSIYGVTMEERGISKTVSMRFNHERGEAEIQPQNIADAVRGTTAPAAPETIAAPAGA